MSEQPLKIELQQFIARFIHSVEQVEILCVLCKEPIKSWTVSEVFRQIQSSEASVAACLKEFLEGGLLVKEGEQYRFSPQNKELSQGVSDLIKAYRERRVTVVELIYKKPDTIQDFADAFKLRKKEK